MFAGRPAMVIHNDADLGIILSDLKIRMESTFIPSKKEAELPAKNLAHFLTFMINNEKNRHKRDKYKEISGHAEKYEWFVSGYINKHKKYLYCYLTTLFTEYPYDYPKDNGQFPIIRDGGSNVCFGVYDIAKQRFIVLHSNGVG
jgi:hypothetical protein